MKTFPDGIHGTRVGCGEYINDWILYHLVKACRAKLTHLGKPAESNGFNVHSEN